MLIELLFAKLKINNNNNVIEMLSLKKSQKTNVEVV